VRQGSGDKLMHLAFIVLRHALSQTTHTQRVRPNPKGSGMLSHKAHAAHWVALY
jgi:hypothetical protein